MGRELPAEFYEAEFEAIVTLGADVNDPMAVRMAIIAKYMKHLVEKKMDPEHNYTYECYEEVENVVLDAIDSILNPGDETAPEDLGSLHKAVLRRLGLDREPPLSYLQM